MIIAVDGPAASGKGTIARALARHYQLPHLDTGLLYRAVAATVLKEDLDPAKLRENAENDYDKLQISRMNADRQGKFVDAKIKDMGTGSMLEGMLVGIERGFFQSEIADAAFREQTRFEKGRLVKVGVNEFVDPTEPPIDTLIIGPETEELQIRSIRDMKLGRNQGEVDDALNRLIQAAGTDENLVPPLVDCARAYCTEGEIVDALRRVFGEYQETPRF